MNASQIVLDHSVKVGHYSGGQWKKRFFDRLGKNRQTTSSKARIYFANPPEGGWRGGLPEANSWKPGKG